MMKKFSWIISKYLIKAILPYFIFSWLLLSVVIFFQQASRFSEIFFSTTIPKNLIWQLTLALVPNVIAFTCPMAVLVGVIIGLSKMQGDSELIAVRAAGVGNFQIALPIVFLGILLSIFAFMVNLRGVPFAAQMVRSVAVQTALYKLESPIEPGVFNTEIAGFTIYVKNGNFENGSWENIFIYNEDLKSNQARLITSKSGRIDSKDELSELVLENAVVNTFPIIHQEGKPNKYISENVGQIRFGIKTKRGELLERISKGDKSLEELGLNELAKFEGKEKTEAELLLQRRLILSITPLIFALLGTALVLRFNRGGRGFGIFLALVSLVGYYLITLLGEQLARTGTISVLSASLLPLGISATVICWLFWSNKTFFNNPFAGLAKRFKFGRNTPNKISRRNFYLDWTTGIMDFDIVSTLFKYFLLTLGFLTAIFLIFTAFELWKFAGLIDGGVWLLGKYLLYLLPFIYIQIAPSALMVAILATFIIKSRQNEIVTWTSAGQSVYRLLLPCFILMLVIGGLNFLMQEYVFPKANRTQDTIRGEIRGGGILPSAFRDGKIWTTNDKKIYSFELAEGGRQNSQKIKNLTIYEFSADETRISSIHKITEAIWDGNKIAFSNPSEKIIWNSEKAEIQKIQSGELADNIKLSDNLSKKPNHLNINETRQQIEASKSELERRNYEIAVEKKYTTLVLPFVITLFTAPFALSLGRKGRVATVGYAIGIWLLFMGINSAFEQMGLNGVMSAKIAVWSPILFFSMVGVFLISRVRT